MFNLGFREVIVNKDSDITISGTKTGTDAVIKVDGFCNLSNGEITPGFVVVAADGVAGSMQQGFGAVVAGNVYSLTFELFSAGNERLDPTMFPYAEKKVLNFKGNVVDFGTSAAAAFTALKNSEAGFEFNYEIVDGGGDIKINSLEVGFGVKNIKLMDVTDPLAPAEVPASGAPVIVEASIGVGLGSQLEAEVKNATFENIDPYGARFGGSGIVDVRAKYTQLIVNTKDSNGWAHHETMGYGLNGEINQADRKLVIWINEASAPVAAGNALAVLT